MTAPTPAQVLAAVKRSGVKYVLEDGWNDPAIAASGTWAPAYVIQHHTANSGAPGDAPSLNWVLRNTYRPIRACHFLIGRSGLVHVVYSLKCFHAGKGGPGQWGDGPAVALDRMNSHGFGIEVESKGTSIGVTDVDGITPAQWDALTRLNAALLDMLGAKGEGRIINHKTWAPGRKTDTLWPDSYIQRLTKDARDRLNARPTLPVLRLADIGWLKRNESVSLLMASLVKAGMLDPALVRSRWWKAHNAALRAYKAAGGFADNGAAIRALGRRYGFTVA